ncbi:partial Chromosome partitioning protein ParA, partial [uncultured bacterium]
LDDHLIAKPLFKVRCSNCKHIFSVDLSPKEDIVELNQTPEKSEKKVITICNQKGGVAKTSTCLNLGFSLSLLGKRVLMCDFDAQSNLSLLLGKNNEASFYEIAQKQITLSKAIKNIYPNLWLLPANTRIALLAKQAMQQPKEFGNFLHETINPIKSHFDYILIDTPPSVKFFTPHALMAADFVIIPTQCEFLAMNGVIQMDNIIRAVSAANPLDYKILVTLYDETNTASKVIYAKLKAKFQQKVFDTIISLDYKMQESQIVNQPLIHYDENSKAAKQYLQLAKQVISL